MTTTLDTAKLANRIDDAVDDGDLTTVSSLIAPLASHEVADVLERLSRKDRAVVFRLLAKDEALTVFESLDAPLQGELIHDLQDEQVTGLFAELDPD
ncbi:magnesium transporter, partial [Tsukamurella tyrosinosolvens]